MSESKQTGFFTTVEFSSDEEDSEIYLDRIAKKDAKRQGQNDDPEERARLKRFEVYNKRTKVMNDKLLIGDYNTIMTELTNLLTDFDKNRSILEKDGYPPHYFKTLLSIEDHISGLTSKDKTRISKEATKALSKLKQKVRKLLEEQAEDLEVYKKNPLNGDNDANSDDDSESEFESESEDEEESQEESQASGDTSWDEDNEDDNQVNALDIASMSRMERRKLWLKDPEDKSRPVNVTAAVRKQKEQQERVYKVQDITQDYSTIDMSEASIHRRLNDIAGNRSQLIGERLNDSINVLLHVLNNLTDKKRRLEIIILLLNMKGEQMRSEATLMDMPTWLEYYEFIQEYLEMISNESSNIRDNVVSYLKGDETKYEKKELESLLISLLTNLDSDWFTLIKVADPESVEYAHVLREEFKLLKLLRAAVEYFQNAKNIYNTGFLAYKLLEHIYFLPEHTMVIVQKTSADYVVRPEDGNYVQTLTKMIYNKVPDSIITVKTALLEAYNLAINGKYRQARDLLLMYNIGDKSTSDVVIGSYYNRALTALGLCAFRHGLIEDCQDILDDICNSGKLKDLLNQTNARGYIEREEKRSLVPYHMSMSIESIESSYFVSVILNEAPALSNSANEFEKKSTSKLFQKLWQFYEKNPLNGPAENHRDIIYCATKELLKGEWKNSYDYINKLKIWSKIPDSESVKVRFIELIKKQAFKAFVSNIKNTSHVLKFDRLAQIFEINEKQLISLTCQMIYNKELEARLDSKTGCLITGKTELGDLESISDKLNQKIYSNINLNEKLFDVKFADVNFSELMTISDSNQYRTSKKQKNFLRIPAN